MAKGKIAKVLHEYKEGTLHSGSKHGPEVTSRKQAIAIALSEARKAGQSGQGHYQAARREARKRPRIVH